jgi:PAS domain S-box-containing protein
VSSRFATSTERRKAEVALERTERELADFFDSASVPLFWIGPDGVIVRANQGVLDLLGYTREEYVGRHVSRFHVDRDVADDALARLFQGNSLKGFPARIRCKNGSVKKVLIDSSSLWEHGRFVHSRCSMFDVTEQRRDEETRSLLAAIVAASDDAIVSKTLEGIILSWNEGAQRLFGYSPAAAIGRSIDLIIPLELQPQERKILERIRQGDRVGSLRDRSRGQGWPACGHAVDASRPLAERDQQTIDVTLPEQPIYLDADPVRLTQVFSNLFNNACQYTEPGGRIWLTAERQKDEVDSWCETAASACRQISSTESSRCSRRSMETANARAGVSALD